PNHGHQPGPAPISAKPSEKRQGPQGRFLADVRGVLIMPRQPAREVISRIQVRNYDLLEACEVRIGWQRNIFQKGTVARNYVPPDAPMLFPKKCRRRE